MEHVVLGPAARHRVVLHRRHPVVQRRFKELGDDVAGSARTACARSGLGHQDRGQSIEELTHPGRQELFKTREGDAQVVLKRCGGHRLVKVAAQVERAQLVESESYLEALEDLAIEAPQDLAVLVLFVKEWKAGLL